MCMCAFACACVHVCTCKLRLQQYAFAVNFRLPDLPACMNLRICKFVLQQYIRAKIATVILCSATFPASYLDMSLLQQCVRPKFRPVLLLGYIFRHSLYAESASVCQHLSSRQIWICACSLSSQGAKQSKYAEHAGLLVIRVLVHVHGHTRACACARTRVLVHVHGHTCACACARAHAQRGLLIMERRPRCSC